MAPYVAVLKVSFLMLNGCGPKRGHMFEMTQSPTGKDWRLELEVTRGNIGCFF
jgi:hypothetical protein